MGGAGVCRAAHVTGLKASAKINDLIRKTEAETRIALLGAMRQTISTVSAQDARGFFEHCGYRAVVQPF
jgi:hypothetical protein